MSATDVPPADLRDVPSLVAGLTLEEKASLTSGADAWNTKPVDRVGIGSLMVSDGPHGLRKQNPEMAMTGIGESYPATCFPPAVGLASSWNPTLLRLVGDALGRETRAADVAVLLGPGVNIKRSPLCGRNFEYFSEDPVLAGELAAALVEGVQRHGVGTSLKHYAVNNQETDRMRVSADVDVRTLREIYLPAFERVVTRARPWTVMAAYNRVNGTFATEHPWLLARVLREEWGFDGVLVSDWGAVNDRVEALEAGLDLEMPGSMGVTDAQLVDAVRSGRLREEVLDRAVVRLLELVAKARAGAAGPAREPDVDVHHALARQAAHECAVLLKNEPDADGATLLPLSMAATGSLAVIGEFARTPRYQGAGSSQVRPTRLDDTLSELRTLAGPGLRIQFAPGYVVTGDAHAPVAPDHHSRRELIAEAVSIAAESDVVLLFLGLPPAEESEGFDRTHLELPAAQIALLEAVAEVNDQIVVVLSNGAVVATDPWQRHARAVLEGWLLGQAGGGAIADLLFGVVNPSGKLAETIPLALEDSPSFGTFPGELGHSRYGEGVLVGYRGHDARRTPVAYPFGHGLSYTDFGYDDLELRVTADDAGSPLVRVAFTVTNTGSRLGQEVAQVYVRDPESTVVRPPRELKAFAKVDLHPGESTRVELTLTARDFSWFHVGFDRWVVEGGLFVVEVGASSRDLRLAGELELTGEDLEEPLGEWSTLKEWAEHPVGGPLLRAELVARAGGALPPLFGPELYPVIADAPLWKVAGFAGVTRPELVPLIEKARAGA